MPIDLKFNYELNEVWHFLFWPYFAQWRPKYSFFKGKIESRIFDKKCLFMPYFSRCLGKLRRARKIPIKVLTIKKTYPVKVVKQTSSTVKCKSSCKKFQKNSGNRNEHGISQVYVLPLVRCASWALSSQKSILSRFILIFKKTTWVGGQKRGREGRGRADRRSNN